MVGRADRHLGNGLAAVSATCSFEQSAPSPRLGNRLATHLCALELCQGLATLVGGTETSFACVLSFEHNNEHELWMEYRPMQD